MLRNLLLILLAPAVFRQEKEAVVKARAALRSFLLAIFVWIHSKAVNRERLGMSGNDVH